jgi:hypothetical protein
MPRKDIESAPARLARLRREAAARARAYRARKKAKAEPCDDETIAPGAVEAAVTEALSIAVASTSARGVVDPVLAALVSSAGLILVHQGHEKALVREAVVARLSRGSRLQNASPAV